MSQPPDERASGAGSSPRTVLEAVRRLTGDVSRVHLREADSEHGATPILDPTGRSEDLLPKGRGNYQVLGEIARGGMGLVLRGHDTDLGRDVALKVLDEGLAKEAVVVQRFVEEAQIGGQLQHPGIVPVYEMGLMVDGRPYFTMKLVKGRTLSELLSRRKSPDDDRRRFLAIFESVCQTMAYAHSKGVIHRDLKPANVMVGAFGEVQVVDWGLAKVLRHGGVEDERRARRETSMTVIETVRSGPGSGGSDSVLGSVMGTPAYMPPEQAMGEHEKLDERADVFALGAILCEILTGRPPYVAAEGERTVVMAAHGRLDPARERIETCGADPELERICLECLATSPVARPRNADEVARAVHAHLAALEERAHRAEIDVAEARVRAREERRRKRLYVGLLATVVLALVAFGVGYRHVESQRMERLATARRALDDVRDEVAALQGQGLFDRAREVARGGLLLVGPGETEDAGLHERAAALVEEAEARAAEEEGRVARLARERAFVESCEELRMRQVGLLFEGGLRHERLVELDAAFAETFRSLGVDMEAGEPTEALALLRDGDVAREAAFALDDWAGIVRTPEVAGSERGETLVWLAVDLDPDPLRVRLRRAWLASDVEELLAIAASDELARAPAATIARLQLSFLYLEQVPTFSSTLQERMRETRRAMILRAASSRPEEFMLSFLAGYDLAQTHAVAIRYAAAARALRPQSPYTHALVGDVLNDVGDLPGAVQAYAEAARLRPSFLDIHSLLGWFRLQLGRYEEAERAYDDALRIDPGAEDLALARLTCRYLAGRLPREELVAAFGDPRTRETFVCNVVGLALVRHPDPAQRDPARALAFTRSVQARNEDDARLSRVVEAHALLELGEATLALEGLDRSEHRDWNDFAHAGRSYVRALACHQLGQRERAEAALTEAELSYGALTGPDSAAWERSMIAGLRREVREELGR